MTAGHTPTFGDLLRRYRTAAGLTQEELAEKAGLSTKGISDLERGSRHRPRRDTVHLLVSALGLADRERAILEAAARQRRASNAPAPDGIPRSAPSRGMIPLVGRADEWRRIENHLSEGNAPPLLLLAGEPGIGKSRLLHEAGIHAVQQGWSVLSGGCHRRSGQEPFAPFLDLLERHLSRQPAAERRLYLRGCAWLVRLLPELAETLPSPEYARGLPPAQERRLMFAAVARYLANVAGPAGILLVLDDLQWAGQDALDLLEFLLRAGPAEGHLRVIGAYRDTEVRAQAPLGMLLADLVREELADRTTLAPLDSADAEQLLRLLLADAAADPAELERGDLREHLLQRTGGVPFFLVSCVQALRSGALGAAARSGSEHTGTDLPWTVAETIRQRVAILPPEARQLLEIAAVSGRSVSRSVLMAVATLAGVDEHTVLSALDAARHARLLVEMSATDYTFPHDLVRETVLADVSRARQALLHRQMAEVLEHAAVQPAVEMLAFHYSQGDVLEKAALYLERSGDRAYDRFANAEAQSYYSMAAARLDELGRAGDAARVRERQAEILVILSRYDEALTALERAADTYRASHNLDGLTRVAAQLGEVHALRGTPLEGIAWVEPLLGHSEAGDLPPGGIATLSVALARLFLVRGQYGEQLAAAERAAEYARSTQDAGVLIEAEYFRGWALLQLGRSAEGLRALEAVVPLAKTATDVRFLAVARTTAAWGHELMGEFELARQHLSAARDVAERFGDTTVLALTLSVQCDVAFRSGDWEQAQADGERALGLLRQMGTSWRTMWPPFCVGQLALARNAGEAAVALFEEALAIAQPYGDPHVARRVQAALAERDLLDGHPEQALHRLLPLLDRPGAQEAQVTVVLPILAWAHLDAGDMGQALAVTGQALTRARDQGLRVPLVDALRVQAQAHARHGRWQGAVDALEEALGIARDMPYPYAEAKTLFVYGQLHRARGEPERTRERLEAALAILNRLGERLYAEHIEDALAELGTDGHRP